MFTKLRHSPAHSTFRFCMTIMIMMVPFGAAVSYWARTNGVGTHKFDPITLAETAIMNVSGLVLIYGIARTRLMAMFEHLGDLFHGRQHPGCFGDTAGAFGTAVISAMCGWFLLWQTISPGARGKSLTAHFVSEIGTVQFYKSGFQTLFLGTAVAIFLYAAVQHSKLSSLVKHVERSPVQMPSKLAKAHPARSRKEALPAARGHPASAPANAWSTTERIG